MLAISIFMGKNTASQYYFKVRPSFVSELKNKIKFMLTWQQTNQWAEYISILCQKKKKEKESYAY